jgi:hypothetical protein
MQKEIVFPELKKISNNTTSSQKRISPQHVSCRKCHQEAYSWWKMKRDMRMKFSSSSVVMFWPSIAEPLEAAHWKVDFRISSQGQDMAVQADHMSPNSPIFENWLAGLNIKHLITYSTVRCFTISRNLLAVTAKYNVACFKTFFFVIMNDKWIVLCSSDGIWSIERTRLFCGDQYQVAV